MARHHRAGGQVELHAARMGELLRSRHRQQGVPGDRQLHRCAVAPVVALQAQGQATQGWDLSTMAFKVREMARQASNSPTGRWRSSTPTRRRPFSRPCRSGEPRRAGDASNRLYGPAAPSAPPWAQLSEGRKPLLEGHSCSLRPMAPPRSRLQPNSLSGRFSLQTRRRVAAD